MYLFIVSPISFKFSCTIISVIICCNKASHLFVAKQRYKNAKCVCFYAIIGMPTRDIEKSQIFVPLKSNILGIFWQNAGNSADEP